MDSLNEINIKVSFGLSGTGQQTPGTLQNERTSPPPPPEGEQAAPTQTFTASGSSSLPPPPGYSSGNQQTPTSPTEPGGRMAPEPPSGSFDKQGIGNKDTGPPQLGGNTGNNAAYSDSPPLPPEEENSKSSGTKNKGDKK